jgi:rhodanese-related sulfurtransferase
MLTRAITIIALVASISFAGPAWSYDSELAKSYEKLFASVEGAGAGKALHLIKPDNLLEKVKTKAPLVVLDVRTPAEAGVYGVTLPGALAIPVNELFEEANLALIPTDKTVVVLCKSGTRATAAGTALRHIGFDNVYILKGGFKALVAYMGPKEANPPPAKSSSTQYGQEQTAAPAAAGSQWRRPQWQPMPPPWWTPPQRSTQ